LVRLPTTPLATAGMAGVFVAGSIVALIILAGVAVG